MGQGAGTFVLMVVTVVMNVAIKGQVLLGALVIAGHGTGSEKAGTTLGARGISRWVGML